MTDNFDRYREFIELCGGLPETNEKGNLDKYYCIELMRRGKDNPDLPAANYHFKNYYIYSWHDLEKYKQEIIRVCTLLRLRAYCSVNYKLMSQVALDTLAESARRIAAHDYKKLYDIFESCNGKYVDKGSSMWVIDVDNVDWDFPVDKMKAYINSMESGYDENVVYIMPTKSGIHFICHPFNLVEFYERFNKNFEDYSGDIPDVKKNALTLLYENL